NSPVNLPPLQPEAPLSHLSPGCTVGGGNFTSPAGLRTSSAAGCFSAAFSAAAFCFFVFAFAAPPPVVVLPFDAVALSSPPPLWITIGAAGAVLATSWLPERPIRTPSPGASHSRPTPAIEAAFGQL